MTQKQIQLCMWDLSNPFHSTLISVSRPCKSYCLEQILRLRWSLLQGESTFPNKCTFIWQSNNEFSGLSLQRNLNESTSFGSSKTWWNIFSMSRIIAYFPFLNFVMTDTKLFNKSIPRKRLSFKHVLLILAEASKTTRTRSGLFTFNTPWWGNVISDGTCVVFLFRW